VSAERWHRRSFLGALVALVTAVRPGLRGLSPPAGTAQAAASLADLELGRRLTDLLRARPKVALLGKIVLWQRTAAPSVGELVDGVLPGALKAQHLRSEKWQLRRTVKARVVADYRALRMTSVSGWLLSQTETRIAALAALEHEPPG
jgi:hypothetical protein